MDEQQNTNAGARPQASPRANPDERFRRARKHMGVATSDPEYLPPVPGGDKGPGYIPPSSPTLRTRANERTPQAAKKGSGKPGGLRYDRYLSTPKRGKSIFTSQQARRRTHAQHILAVLIILAVALALVWFLLLR